MPLYLMFRVLYLKFRTPMKSIFAVVFIRFVCDNNKSKSEFYRSNFKLLIYFES